jgi:hypothetical protein
MCTPFSSSTTSQEFVFPTVRVLFFGSHSYS